MSEVRVRAEHEMEAYRLLTKLFLLLDDYDRRFFLERSLSARQFFALQHLDTEQGHSMVELSRLLLTDKSNVTAIVDRLEKDGWATRTADPTDRRVNLVVLTDEGRRVRDRVDAAHRAHIRELLAVEGDERLGAMLELLHPVARRLEAYLARAEPAATSGIEDAGDGGADGSGRQSA